MSGCVLALALACAAPPVTAQGDTVPKATGSALAVLAARTTPAIASSPAPAEPAPDRWLAEDKLKHFTLSFAATQMGYGGARLLAGPEPALRIAASAALGLGLAKEIRDSRAGGRFSLKDLAWDAAGLALAVAFARRIE